MLSKAKKPICILTDNAVRYFQSVLVQNEKKKLKLSIKSGGCSGFKYDLDFVCASDALGEHDEVIEVDNITLIIDSIAIMYVLGTTIDYKQTLGFSGLTFDNPSATFKCGCGESFSV